MIFMNKEITNELEIEKDFANYNLKSQKNLKKIILKYMQNFADSTEYIELAKVDYVLGFLNNLKEILDLSNKNIEFYESVLHDIDELENLHQSNSYDFENKLNSFNSKCSDNKEILENTLKIEECLYSISEKSEFKFLNVEAHENASPETPFNVETVEPKSTVAPENNFQDITPSVEPVQAEEKIEEINIEPEKEVVAESSTQTIVPQAEEKVSKKDAEPVINSSYQENTLVVSETSKEVILPFDMAIVENKFKNNREKYSSVDEVIEEYYTLPIDTYKNPFISRFREAFKLMRNKQKSSISEAFELGVELMFNYNLHPAIISACKNLDELDIYLDYLESGETNKFNCFKIIFELPPLLSKTKTEF